jgi:hypothetical protein
MCATDAAKSGKSRAYLGLLIQLLLSLCVLTVVIWKLEAIARVLLAKQEPGKTSKFIPAAEGTWRFIVSGDSRNCGDVVMPAIAAQGIERYEPSFYWHLGDLRAIYKIDEDMAAAAETTGQSLSCESYHKRAWQDFIDHQIVPFGTTRFYLGIGNHEVIPPKTPAEFSSRFQDWLLTPRLLMANPDKEQIAAAKSGPCQQIPARPYLSATPYYHWVRGRIDFISLDNSSESSPAINWIGLIARSKGRTTTAQSAPSSWACMKLCLRAGRATTPCATTRSPIRLEKKRVVKAASMFTTPLWSFRRRRKSTYLRAIRISI